MDENTSNILYAGKEKLNYCENLLIDFGKIPLRCLRQVQVKLAEWKNRELLIVNYKILPK